MKKTILISIVVLAFSTQVNAHGGRTDKSGGHKCSAKSVSKGLCTGYHNHNSGAKILKKSKPLLKVKQRQPTVKKVKVKKPVIKPLH